MRKQQGLEGLSGDGMLAEPLQQPLGPYVGTYKLPQKGNRGGARERKQAQLLEPREQTAPKERTRTIQISDDVRYSDDGMQQQKQ